MNAFFLILISNLIIYLEESAKVLEDEMIEKLCKISGKEKNALLEFLDSEGVINRSNEFKECGQEKLKEHIKHMVD